MIEGISIKGKCFGDGAELRFFREDRQRVAVVYGRNGSGKSTISRAFSEFGSQSDRVFDDSENGQSDMTSSGEAPEGEHLNAQLIYSPETMGDSTENGTASVLVFNESFIDQNVKVRGDGLGTVVLFGEQAEIQSQIDDAKTELSEYREKLDVAIVSRESAESSRQVADSTLSREIKRSWGPRSRDILDTTNATKSWGSTMERLRQIDPVSGVLSEQLTVLLDRISRYRSIATASAIDSSWPSVRSEQFIAKVSSELLSKALVVPTGEGLSATVAKSLGRFEEHVHSAEAEFADPELSYCPMCQRDFSNAYRTELLEAIRSAVDDESDAFKVQLEKAKCQIFDLEDAGKDERLGRGLIDRAMVAVATFNSRVEEWNALCEEKKSQLYTPLRWSEDDLRLAASALDDSVRDLESARQKWNDEVNARDREKERLLDLNDRVSRLELAGEFEDFDKAVRDVISTSGAEKEAKRDVERVEGLLARLSAQLANVQIAADEINIQMRAIFAEKDRLTLELRLGRDESEESVYQVLNRGRKIRPEDLSVGERNILALTYFFTTVGGALDKLGARDSILLVIDDPISSVDVDNRLGIHGYFETQMRKCFRKCDSLRVVVLTHDLSVAREISKSAGSAIKRAGVDSGKQWTRSGFSLRSRGLGNERDPLVLKNFDKLNEYEALLEVAYVYATAKGDSSDGQELTVGNVVRRVFEAFSTFIYKAGILDREISDAYEECTKRDLSIDLNAGHRGFLHDQSHSADGLTSLRDYGGFSGLERDEQVLHVRRVLALMYTLQEAHMKKYLPAGAHNEVEKWKVELMSDSSVM